MKFGRLPPVPWLAPGRSAKFEPTIKTGAALAGPVARTGRGRVAGLEYFLQQLINGLTLGAIYGLIALGYTMVYGIIGMINFAHGEVYMVGAFIAVTAFT